MPSALGQRDPDDDGHRRHHHVARERLAPDDGRRDDAEDRLGEEQRRECARAVVLQQPEVDDEVEAGDDEALEGDGAGQSTSPSRGGRLEDRRQHEEDGDTDDGLSQQELHRILALHGPGQIHGPLGQDQRAEEHDGVPDDRWTAERETAAEEDHDTAEGHQDSEQAAEAEAVAGNHEVGEHDGLHRIEIQDDGDVGGGRHRRGDVHRSHLHGEEHAERPPLLGRDAEAAQPTRAGRPHHDDRAAQQEAQRGQPERWRVFEAGLDRHGVDAPEERGEQRATGAAQIDRPVGRGGVGGRHFDAPQSSTRHNALMKIGLIGLPRSGKTTLFNLLTGARVATSRYDTGRVELNTGVARVPDTRVDRLSALFKPKKTTYATFDVVDLAGIAKGERAGLDTKEFRNADALLHVARAFADPALGAPAPRRDIEDLETELILADLEVVERRLERLEVSLKKRRTDVEAREQEVLTRLKTALEAETPLRALTLPDEDVKAVRGFTFLSQKPILHCVNVDEKSVTEGDRVAATYGL